MMTHAYVSSEKILYLIQSINVKKANGPDGISGYMLKATAKCIASPLAKLFSLSLSAGKFPTLWKLAHVVPIAKFTNKSDASNYRPISLLSVVSKLLEKYVHSILWDHLLNQAPLSSNQWGYQSGKSTVASLLAATNDWQSKLDNQTDVMCIFFDFQKAFDKVPHQRLMKRLADLKLHPLLLAWLCSYLSGRRQHVIVNGECSSSLNVLSGVPQGSILGPLLFLIYIDTIFSVKLSEETKISLYADDILIYKAIQGDHCYDELQQDINSISLWSENNLMCLNITKCKCMLLSHRRNTHHPKMMLNDEPLEYVTHMKYLGVIISSNLQWSLHIDEICKKAKRMLGLIYRNYAANISCSSIILRLYLALVRPCLEYASQVWDPHLMRDIQKLENVQKFALRICCGRYGESYENLLDTFQIPTLSNRRLFLSLSTFFNIINGHVYFPSFDFDFRPSIVHSTRTHHSQTLRIPFAHGNSLKFSFFHKTPQLWNNLPQEAVSATDLHSFKFYISPIFLHT